MGNLWMVSHPRSRSVRLPIGQDVDNLVSFQVHHDRAERSAAPKRKIIKAQALHVLCLRRGQRHHPAHNGHPGGSDPQMRGQACPEPAACC